MGQLSLGATTTELQHLNERARMPQTTEPTCPGARAPQLERENRHATTREKPAYHNKEPARLNKRSRVWVPQLRPKADKKERKDERKNPLKKKISEVYQRSHTNLVM